jgi:hypothetical protein
MRNNLGGALVESSVVPKLVIIKGLSPETCCITSDSIYLGRLPTNDFVLAGEGISRKHARIHRRGEEYYIQDLGSTNGTFVNDVRLDNERKLSHGDVIKLGRAVALEFDFPASDEMLEEAPPDLPGDEDRAESPVKNEIEEVVDESQEAERDDLQEIEDEPQPAPEAVQGLLGPNQKVSELALKVNELISRIIKNSDLIKSHLEELNVVQEKYMQSSAQMADAEENISANDQNASFDMSAATDAASAIREDAVRAANILYSLLQELDADALDASEYGSYNLEEPDE